jgi:2-aminoadipate transaminase
MAEGLYPANVQRLQIAYRQRREALLEALKTAMPQGTTWTRPAGGYFTWVTLPAGDTRARLSAVKQAGSGYIPGTTFLPPKRPEACGPLAERASRSFRLAWSRYSPENLRESVRRMGEALRG